MKKNELKGLIDKHKSAAKTDGEAKAVTSIFGDLEKLIEDTGQQEQFQQAYTNYITEKTNEITSIRCARKCMLWLSAILSIIVILAFYSVLSFLLFCPIGAQHIIGTPEAAKVAFISASFISSFGLIAIILKGILKTNEKEDGGILPENIKLLAQIFREEIIK